MLPELVVFSALVLLAGRWLFLGFEASRPEPLPRAARVAEARELIEQTVQRLGLVREELGTTTTLKGTRGVLDVEVRVVLTEHPSGDLRFEQQITVTAPEPFVDEAVSIKPRLPGGRSGGVLQGEPVFDKAARVSGPPDLVFALLSPLVRATVIGHGGTWILQGSSLTWNALRAPTYLLSAAEKILEVAQSWYDLSPDPFEGLRERAERDPVLGVRRHALQSMLRSPERDPRTVDVIRALLGDPNPRIQLEAAIGLGEEGRPFLIEQISRTGMPKKLRMLIATHLPPAEAPVRAALHRLMESQQASDRMDGIELLGRLGSPEDLGRLYELSRASRGGSVRRAAALAHARLLTRFKGLEGGSLSVVGTPAHEGALSAPPMTTSHGAESPLTSAPES